MAVLSYQTIMCARSLRRQSSLPFTWQGELPFG